MKVNKSRLPPECYMVLREPRLLVLFQVWEGDSIYLLFLKHLLNYFESYIIVILQSVVESVEKVVVGRRTGARKNFRFV